jgi:hypothetical protein
MPTKVLEAAAPAEQNGTTARNEEVVGSIDDLLAISDLVYETVYVPEWGRAVRLVSLTGEERNRVAVANRAHARKSRDEDEATVYFQARIILASLVDAEGVHIGDQSKAAALMGKNGSALTRLFTVCMRLSGIGQDEEEEAVEALKATPSDDTGSD